MEEVEGGIISGWRLLDQPGQDVAHLMPSLVARQARFGRPPWLVTGDRGVFSAENERRAKAAGVARVVLPAAGKVAPERARAERQRSFRRGFRFRAGTPGPDRRAAALPRARPLSRSRRGWPGPRDRLGDRGRQSRTHRSDRGGAAAASVA